MAKRASVPRVTRILNCLPSRDTAGDWSLDTAAGAGLLGAALPAHVDLRERWWPVGDQGETGSCVGWATADAVLRWHFVKAGWLGKSEPLSPRYIWMAAKETDELTARPTSFIEQDGTSLKAALDVARKFGAVTDAELPFSSGTLFKGSSNVFYAKAARLKIASYFNLGQSLADWRNWLANNGPILTRINIDATWQNATDTDGKLEVYRPDTAGGGHALALVGYTQEHFIVRNSWGDDWGDDGFAYASNAYAAAAMTEAYGVSL